MIRHTKIFQIQIPSQKLTHLRIRSENTAQGVIAKSSLFFFQTPCQAACVSINIHLQLASPLSHYQNMTSKRFTFGNAGTETA